MKRVKARANANIALIKYWGKRDKELFLPYNSSLSMTLDTLYTVSEVEFTDGDRDIFILNDEEADEKERLKISKFIDLFRDLAKEKKFVKVNSKNYFPTAAGLASSASGYAALATGLNRLFSLNLERKDLSKLARRGSGSATRSIFGGIVEWKKGEDSDTSYAEALEVDWDLSMLIVLVDSKKKAISSRSAMEETIRTSPYYPAWVKQAEKDLCAMKKAVKEKNFKEVGEIAEANAMRMHASMLASFPPIMYFKEESLKAMDIVRGLRSEKIEAYYTMDAGPNVKVLCQSKDLQKIIDRFKKYFPEERLIPSSMGEGARVIEETL